jgi:pyruvate dehydrogenase E2 component (dihydrolipoamide acetyltransferase)
MALAVDTERGLIVPVIRDAGTKGLEEIALMRRDLVERVLANTIGPDELVGGTFTITNLGKLGIDHFTPIINPPQVAILGVCRIRKVPAVHKGKIRIRQVIGLALTCDHRVIDGAPAARFLSEILNLIENPDLIWM